MTRALVFALDCLILFCGVIGVLSGRPLDTIVGVVLVAYALHELKVWWWATPLLFERPGVYVRQRRIIPFPRSRR